MLRRPVFLPTLKLGRRSCGDRRLIGAAKLQVFCAGPLDFSFVKIGFSVANKNFLERRPSLNSI
jgi:hypothetical protein